MVSTAITTFTREALYLVLIVSGIPVSVALMVGLAVAIFQATTQLQEQTLTFAPKLIFVFGTIALAGPWIFHQIYAFTFHLFDRFPSIVR